MVPHGSRASFQILRARSILTRSSSVRRVLGQAHVVGCHVGNGKIPFFDLLLRDPSLSVPVVARLPVRQIEFLPYVIAAVFPMIVGKGMQDKAVRGVVVDRYRERTIFRRMSGARRQNPPAGNFPAKRASDRLQ